MPKIVSPAFLHLAGVLPKTFIPRVILALKISQSWSNLGPKNIFGPKTLCCQCWLQKNMVLKNL